MSDGIVQRARVAGALQDAVPFGDQVGVRVSTYRTGQLTIDDVGPDGVPNYRVVFAVTVDVTVGYTRFADPIDVTNNAPARLEAPGVPWPRVRRSNEGRVKEVAPA